jgi:crotonobetainyl-CoA:carnitine CoA-transferase CaiB-like acyl-CoA transferase
MRATISCLARRYFRTSSFSNPYGPVRPILAGVLPSDGYRTPPARFSARKQSAERERQAPIATISDIFLTKKSDRRGKIFDENGLICGRVLSPTDVVNGKQVSKYGFFTEIDRPIVGPIKLIASPVDFSDTPATIRTPAPKPVSTSKRFSWDWGINGKTSLIAKSRVL